MNELTCQETVTALMDYVEQVLGAEKRSALEQHLRRCPRCVEFLEAYRATPGILRRATDAAVSPELASRLRAIILS